MVKIENKSSHNDIEFKTTSVWKNDLLTPAGNSLAVSLPSPDKDDQSEYAPMENKSPREFRNGKKSIPLDSSQNHQALGRLPQMEVNIFTIQPTNIQLDQVNFTSQEIAEQAKKEPPKHKKKKKAIEFKFNIQGVKGMNMTLQNP
jgi:hypothetical protein